MSVQLILPTGANFVAISRLAAMDRLREQPTLSKSTCVGKPLKMFRAGGRSCYTAVIEGQLGDRQRKCRLHKMTNWLLR
jgi:hypothetical protein